MRCQCHLFVVRDIWQLEEPRGRGDLAGVGKIPSGFGLRR